MSNPRSQVFVMLGVLWARHRRRPLRLAFVLSMVLAPAFLTSMGVLLSEAFARSTDALPPSVYIGLGNGAGSESRSLIDSAKLGAIIAEIEKDDPGAVTGAATHVALEALIESPDSHKTLSVTLRAPESVGRGSESKRALKLIEGRMPSPGSHEILVAPQVKAWLARQSAKMDKTLIGHDPWSVVGTATYLDRRAALEIYADASTIRQQMKLGNTSSSFFLWLRADAEKAAIKKFDLFRIFGTDFTNYKTYVESRSAEMRSKLQLLWLTSSAVVGLIALVAMYLLASLNAPESARLQATVLSLGMRKPAARRAAIIEATVLGTLAGSLAAAAAIASMSGRNVDAWLPTGGLSLQAGWSSSAMAWPILVSVLLAIVAQISANRRVGALSSV